jgi:2,3,4,5-tetrahydropyridine-2-carboxylate N-succinyltransferase
MSTAELANTIEEAWNNREEISSSTKGPIRDAVEAALDALDSGQVRVSEKKTRRVDSQ